MRIFVAGLLAGVSLVLGALGWLRPYCPQEDSCRGDFQTHWYGNGWTGVEDTP